MFFENISHRVTFFIFRFNTTATTPPRQHYVTQPAGFVKTENVHCQLIMQYISFS